MTFRQNKSIQIVFLVVCAMFSGPNSKPGAAAYAAAPHLIKSKVRELSAPTEATSLETASFGVTGLGVFASRLLVLPARNLGLIIDVAFHAGKATRLETFGPLSSQQRLSVVKDPVDWDLVGADLSGGRILLFEAITSSMIEADPSTGKETFRRSVPWDLIKPPADRGGEATHPETAALRLAFKRAWLATSGLHIAGMARMPAAWHAGDQVNYLLATRMIGFPLVQMACSAAEPSSCMIVRKCNLEGAHDLQPSDITGIGVVASQRLVVVGERQNKRLASFHFSSCFHLPRVATYALPTQLKTLTNLTIDAEERLWLTTARPDDYLNASVYFWSKGAW